jgi:hypothetical protein
MEQTIEKPTSLAYRVFLRGLRTFVAGGLGTMIAISFNGFTFKDLETYLVALIGAFITGGLAALDKAIRG